MYIINIYIYINRYINTKDIYILFFLYKQLRTAVRRACIKLGLKSYSVTKQSKHLDFSHPSMLSVREYVKKMINDKGIEPLLLGNFDQVWSVHYEQPHRVLYKHESQRGKLSDPLNRKLSLRRVLKCINDQVNGIVPQESQDALVQSVCKDSELNAAGNLNPVDYARSARTCTTLSWSDGDLGRAWITLAPGTMCNT